ncbi:MAG: hypothetical protein ACR2PI_09680 [Hyphomicrobiaceae bacterium]
MVRAGNALDTAVTKAYDDGAVSPYELGGDTSTEAFTNAVVERIE